MPDVVAEETRGRVRLPAVARSPFWELSRRVLLAVALLGFTVALVYFDRAGYRDNADPTRAASTWSTRSTTRPSR